MKGNDIDNAFNSYASILKWMSFSNQELLGALGAWFRPLIGRDPYNKKNVDAAAARTNTIIGVLEAHLLNNTFLVTEKLTLADIFVASITSRGFQFVCRRFVSNIRVELTFGTGL